MPIWRLIRTLRVIVLAFGADNLQLRRILTQFNRLEPPGFGDGYHPD
jgi:hypothetical protein